MALTRNFSIYSNSFFFSNYYHLIYTLLDQPLLIQTRSRGILSVSSCECSVIDLQSTSISFKLEREKYYLLEHYPEYEDRMHLHICSLLLYHCPRQQPLLQETQNSVQFLHDPPHHLAFPTSNPGPWQHEHLHLPSYLLLLPDWTLHWRRPLSDLCPCFPPQLVLLGQIR